MPICRVTAALCLDIAATPETLTGLRVVQDRVGRVEGMLGFDIALFGGVPVFCHPVPGPDVTVHGHAPPAERFPLSSPSRRRPRRAATLEASRLTCCRERAFLDGRFQLAPAYPGRVVLISAAAVPLSATQLRRDAPSAHLSRRPTMQRANRHLSTSAARADALFVSPPQRQAVRLVLRSRADRTARPSQALRPHAAAWARFREFPPSYEERSQ